MFSSVLSAEDALPFPVITANHQQSLKDQCGEFRILQEIHD
jgi:hypothetical protein